MLIFVSRILSPDSPIQQIVQKNSMDLIHESLIEIENITIEKMPIADWHFFYSKNGVDSYVANLPHLPINTSVLKYAAIGPGTGEYMLQQGLPCHFIGDGTAKSSLPSFIEQSIAGESVLFLRAQNSANTFCQLLAPWRQVFDLPIYNNEISPQSFGPIDIGIFTSSLNAKAFFANNLAPKIASIAIGHPTLNSLLKLGCNPLNTYVSAETSEEGLAQMLSTLLNQ